MADEITGKSKPDAQSILAATATRKAAPVRRTAVPVKPAAKVDAPAKPETASAPEKIAPAPVAKAVPPAMKPGATPVAPAPVAKNPPAAVPADTVKETVMATTIENVATDTTAKAQAIFADVNDRAKGAMAKSTKAFEDMNAFGKGNVEALVESSKIAAKGVETLGQDAAEFARKSLEEATTAFKTLATVKSPTEFMKLHSDYVRSAFDAMVAETSRSTETMLKLAGEVAQPISNRIAVAADKMKIAA